MTDVDVIATEIIRNRLVAATDEMAKTLVRTAFNPLLYEVQDYGVCIVSPRGELWAETPGCTIFSRVLPDVVKSGIESHGLDGFAPGDVLIANDPYTTGTHISDTSVYMPVFSGSRLVAFAGTTAHWADIGGKNPGGWCPDTTDVYQEGVCFRNEKLVVAGRPVEGLWSLIRNNVRVPDMVIGDLNAQIAAARQGAERISALCEKYGAATVDAGMTRVIDQTERVMRQAIADLPNGHYAASIGLDSDGVDPDGKFTIALETTIDGERLKFSLAGCSESARGPINIPEIGTRGTLCSVIKGLLLPHDPTNEGHARFIEFDIPPGRIVSPERPAPCDSYGYAIEAMTELIFQSLADTMPDKCPAGGFQLFGVSFSRTSGQDGPPFIHMEPVDGGNGGQPTRDGATMMFVGNGDVPNIPVEVLETRYPLRVERNELQPSVAGVGKYNGGFGLDRDYRVLESGISLMFATENTKEPIARGMRGGTAGAPSCIIINPDSDTPRILRERTSGIGPIEPGTLVRARSGGGGGWGDPKDRDSALIERDIRNGFYTREQAQTLFGVQLE